MKALYLKDDLQLQDVSIPKLEDNEALIRVAMAGICNTDLELVKGYMGFQGVLGHEFVGVVEETTKSEWIGKRICGEINFGCGNCPYCLRGLNRHCPNRTTMGILNQNGAFAEYVVVPNENLHEISDAIHDKSAVFVEPLAAAMEVLEQIQIEPNSDVAVIGDGKLGLLICQVLKLTGARVFLVGKHQIKLDLAQSWGVETLHVKDVKSVDFDVVVEVSGSANGFATAMQLVRPRGTIVLKSTYHGNLELNAAPIVIDEITIVGSRCGPFAAAIRVLEKKLIDVESLIDKIFSFNQALAAFEYAYQPGTLKVILDFNEQT